jgi:hypothetical protein
MAPTTAPLATSTMPPTLASTSTKKTAILQFLQKAQFEVHFQSPLDAACLDTLIPISACFDSISKSTRSVDHSLGILDVLKGFISAKAIDNIGSTTGDSSRIPSIPHTLPLLGYNFFGTDYTALHRIRDNHHYTLGNQLWAYGDYCVKHHTSFNFVIEVVCVNLAVSSSWTGRNFDHVTTPSSSPAFGSPNNSTSPNGNSLSHRFIYDSSIPTLVSHSTPVSLGKPDYTYCDKTGFAPPIQHTKICLGSSHIPHGRLVPTPSPVSVSICQLQADTIDYNGPLHTDVSHPDSFVPADSNVAPLSDTGDPAASNDESLSDSGNHDPLWTVDTVDFTSMTPDQLQHFQQQGFDSSVSVDGPPPATADLTEHWAADTVDFPSWHSDQLQAFQQSVPTDSIGHGSSVSPDSFDAPVSDTGDPAEPWTTDADDYDDYDDYNSWTSDQLHDSWTSDQTPNF